MVLLGYWQTKTEHHLIIISELFFTAVPIPHPTHKCVHACMRACVCVVSVIVKHPVLPPCAVDGHSRNPLYLLLRTKFMKQFCFPFLVALVESNAHPMGVQLVNSRKTNKTSSPMDLVELAKQVQKVSCF